MKSNKLSEACIQIYTGEGKGKTTAALGCALRMLGIGGKVMFGQFIKGRILSSEFNILNKFPDQFTYRSFGRGRFIKGNPSEEDLKSAAAGLIECREIIQSAEYDLIVLDELNGAIGCGLFSVDEISEFLDFYKQEIKKSGRCTELIITGRNAPARLIDAADLVSEIKSVKHYFQAGIPARAGIEM
jgi:cob(I)alamin adenosyltransferase